MARTQRFIGRRQLTHGGQAALTSFSVSRQFAVQELLKTIELLINEAQSCRNPPLLTKSQNINWFEDWLTTGASGVRAYRLKASLEIAPTQTGED